MPVLSPRLSRIPSRKVLGAVRRFALPHVASSRRLPLRYGISDSLGEHEPELVHLERIVKPGGVAIDAGANHGFYAFRMSALFDEVIAIEPNTAVSQELEWFNPGNVRIVSKAVSSGPGHATLYIPRQNGRKLEGWASLDASNLPGANELTELKVELCSIDSLELTRVSFLKIDVEGHEHEVLLGAAGTIRRDRPRILVEVRPANEARVLAMMSGWGYRRVTLQELAGVTGSSDNYLFFPLT